MNQLPRAVELGGSVVAALKAGSPLWCRLMGGLVTGYHFGGHQEQADRARELLLRTSPEPDATAAYAEALTLLGASDGYAGLRQRAEIALGRIVEVNSALMEQDALVRGWMGMLKGHLQCFFEARPWQMYLVSEQAVRDFSAVGMERNAHLAQASVALALATLGEVPRAVELLRKVMADIQRMEQLLSLSHVRYYLIHVLLNSSEPAHHQEGHALVLEWLACDEPDALRRGTARSQLAKALLVRGELREAEMHARQACGLLTPHLLTHGIYARTVLSTTLLAQGRATEAREVAELGVRELERMRSQGVYAVAMHLALVDACFAEGDTEAGEAALREALRCVHARASDIPEAAARERFLRQVPENSRTVELARQRWGDAAV
jgi:tetratricopeptide (TPR) repeat protein